MSEASPPEAGPRSRPSVFIVAHVVAVVLLHSVALIAGGGFASGPFPPDLPARPSAAAPAMRIAPDRDDPSAAGPVSGLPANTDIAPPWTFDRDGRAQLSAR